MKLNILKQIFSIIISVYLILLPLSATNIKTDGSTNTTIKKSRNNTTVVNIANPNSKGLSHNRYDSFSVSKKGAILNNSTTHTNTLLGGWIYGNAHLNKAAKVILNEITSTNRSVLNGYIEVGGKKADVVIANPNGISINGGGFLNSAKVTLSTGTPVIKDGSIDKYVSFKHDITVGQGGLNSGDVDIYTNYLKLNGAINAANLKANLQGDGVNGLLLDSSLIGGMYANKIVLVGSSKGLGVNLPPEVLASSGDITISNDGAIVLNDISSSGDIDISSTNTITNQSTAQAGQDITFDGETINNTGTIISNTNHINSDSLTNDGLIQTTKSLNIETTNLTNNKDIKAGTGTSTINTNTFTNNSKITSQDNLVFKSNNISNYGVFATTNDMTINSKYLNNYQTIYSGANMNLWIADSFINYENSNLITYNDMSIARDDTGAKTLKVINDKANIETLSGDISIGAIELNNIGVKPEIKKDNIRVFTSKPKTVCTRGPCWNNYNIITTTKDKMELLNQDKLKPATISSGKDMNLNIDKAINQFSLISSSGDMKLDIKDSLDNSEDEKVLFITTVSTAIYREGSSSKGWGKGRTYFPVYHGTSTNIDKKVLQSIGSTIQAGGSITGDVSYINNGTIESEATINSSTTPQDIQEQTTIEHKPINTVLNIPKGNNGLFIEVQEPNSNYLFETNREFTINGNFISSNYMMDRLGLDLTKTTKRVGDAFYEQKLISDSIFRQTGAKWLDPQIAKNNAQFRYLMDNGLKASKELELAVGVSLTKHQIDSLTQDIVWLEEQIVQGQTVLVPVVYIANVDKYNVQGSKIVAANDINLETNTLTNSGTIKAANIKVKARNTITNFAGNIEATKNISLTANNDITNTSGSIKAETIDMATSYGDIINQRYSRLVDFSNGSTTDRKTAIGQAGSIQTTKGNLNLNTTNGTVKVIGSHLQAKKDINIKANKFIATTTVNTKEFFGGDSDNYIKEKSTTNLGSNIKANNININTKEDTTIRGSQLNSKENISITANKVNVLSVADENYKETKTSSEGFLSSKSTTTTDYSLANKSSKLKSGGKLTINSKDDINIVSSDIDSDGGADINSKDGNVNVIAMHDVKIHDVKKKKSGFSLSISSKGVSTTKHTEEGSLVADYISKGAVLSSGKSLKIKAKKDITLQDVDIDTKEQLSLDGYGVNILNGVDKKITSNYKKTIRDYITGAMDKNGASVTAGIRYNHDEEKTVSTNVSQSNIKTGGDMTIKTKKDLNIVSANIDVGNDMDLDVNENINIFTAKNTTTRTTSNTKADINAKLSFDTNVLSGIKDTKDMINMITDGTLSSGLRSIKDMVKNLVKGDSVLDGNEEGINNISKMNSTYSNIQGGPKANSSLKLNASIEKSSSTTTQAQSVFNNITTNNNAVFKTTKGDIGLSGVNIQTNNSLTIDSANDIDITSATNTFNSETKTDKISGSYDIVSQDISASWSKDRYNYDAVNFMNSYINTNKLTIKSKNTTTLKGVNTNTNKLYIDTNNLNLISQQDISNLTTSSYGLSGGTSYVAGHYNNTKANTAWTTNQTSLKTNEGTINIDKHTYLNGSTISTANKLTLNTNTLIATNIDDTDTSNTKGINLNHTQHTNTASLQYANKDKRQLTLTTLANVSLNIKDKTNSTDISTINTDINKAQTITKDKNIENIGITNTFNSAQQTATNQENTWSNTSQVLGEGVGEVVTNVGGSKESAKKVADMVESGYEVGTNTINTLGTNLIDKNPDKTLGNKGTDYIGFLPNKANSGGLTQNIATVKDGDLQLSIKNGKKITGVESIDDIPEYIEIVYSSGMMNKKQDTQEGYEQLIGERDKNGKLEDPNDLESFKNDTMLMNRKTLLVTDPTHGGIADTIESFISWIGIPTGDSMQKADLKDKLNSNGKPILFINHSKSNSIDKIANRILNFQDKMIMNIKTISLGSPEYAGKDTNKGDTLNNASKNVGENLMYGFNNENDFISLFGFNKRKNANVGVKKGIEDGHGVVYYNKFFKKKNLKENLKNMFNWEHKHD